MFTVKVMSSYACLEGGTSQLPPTPYHVSKCTVIEASRVSSHALSDTWMIEIDGNEHIFVPFFHTPDDWMRDGGVVTSVFVENERGKTVISARSEPIESREPVMGTGEQVLADPEK